MTTASCHTCVYACLDPCQALLSFSTGFPARPMCANHPDTPGLLRPTRGGVCRNYRPKPPEPSGEVRRIVLVEGLYVSVDAADYERLSQYRWHLCSGYAARYYKGRQLFMHRDLMQPPKRMVVDHIDHNKTNNCRANLRICTPAENQRNRVKRFGAGSRYKGVCYKKDLRKYYARFRINGQRLWLGCFDDEAEAARAYDRQAVACAGEFAYVNFPEEWPPERRQQVYAARQ
jgi:hypothetical protein